MNGFHSLRLPQMVTRQLLTYAVAGWLACTAPAQAQEDQSPTPPPAIPQDNAEEEEVRQVEVAPRVLPPTRVAPTPGNRKSPQLKQRAKGPSRLTPQTRLIPTRPSDVEATEPHDKPRRFGEKTELIPTEFDQKNTLTRQKTAVTGNAWAEPIEADSEVSVVSIEQVDGESLVPGGGLDAAPGELPAGEMVEPDSASEEPLVKSLDEASPSVLRQESESTEDVVEPEPVLQAAPGEPAEMSEDVEAEPVPLGDRIGHPQRVPVRSNVRRTAAAEEATPYHPQGAGGARFSPNDAVHTVASGESFWSISKKHYRLGRYSAALAEYNKSRNVHPDRLKPGMKVIVPSVQTLEQRFPQLISGLAPTATKAESNAPVKSGFFINADGHPMYRIGEGDTLSDIAQSHLGRSSRWPQIVALNKDTLPNPDRMKLGVILRLPSDASEAVQAE